MRGEFIRGDGLVIPNNITTWGCNFFLSCIFNPDLATTSLYMGLCSGVYAPDVMLSMLDEPTQGINGYTRQSATRASANWTSNAGQVNGESYAESNPHVFAATGSGFSKPVSRLFLTLGINTDYVMALSGAFPAPVTILPTTPIEQRTFKYRLYLR